MLEELIEAYDGKVGLKINTTKTIKYMSNRGSGELYANNVKTERVQERIFRTSHVV